LQLVFWENYHKIGGELYVTAAYTGTGAPITEEDKKKVLDAQKKEGEEAERKKKEMGEDNDIRHVVQYGGDRTKSLLLSVLVVLVAILVGLLAALLGVTTRKTWGDAIDIFSSSSLSGSSATFNSTCVGTETLYLVEQFCTQQQFMVNCFTMIGEVEQILTLENKTQIYAYLDSLEPQTGNVTWWAVDETEENTNSHLDLGIQGVVQYFNNTAYYYAAREHRLSVPCGGFTISFWRKLDGIRSVQLVYCNKEGNIRVCGGFDLYEQPH